MDFPQQVLFPQKTIFKKGSVLEIAAETREFGLRGVIVHGQSLVKSGKLASVIEQFSSMSKVETYCRASGEPDLEEISFLIEKARQINAEWIIGIGGGSVIDLAKAAAGLFNGDYAPAFYQDGGKLEKPGIPFIAVPTTAGTGSEASANAVIIDKQKKIKRSIRDITFLAKKVVFDVDLLKTLSSQTLAYSAMDALVQGYESYISKNATWFSETLALKAIDLINKNIISAFKTADEESLSSLLLGSYFAGIALSSSRLGVIHGIAHPLGFFYNQPHGLVCAVCFSPGVKINFPVITKEYAVLSNLVGCDFLKRIEVLIEKLEIRSPFNGFKIIEKEKIIYETLISGSTAANPKLITEEDVDFLLRCLFK
ncbi:MAG: iron-containing alcohol dehydrogenase [Candidatus Omnitrophica bacterium]|nr:iron-containing alcohol dehydrogenase [Candidatus Omnitrophota bacterium]